MVNYEDWRWVSTSFNSSNRGVLGPPTRGMHGSRGEPPGNFRAYLYITIAITQIENVWGVHVPPVPIAEHAPEQEAIAHQLQQQQEALEHGQHQLQGA